MKKAILLLIITILSSSNLIAKEGEKPPISDKRLAKMQQQVELSDEQIAEMRRIRDEGGSKQEMRSVLTKEQRQTLKELKQEQEKSLEAIKQASGEAAPE